MKKYICFVAFYIFLLNTQYIFAQHSDFQYLNQKPPGTKPEKFASGFISKNNEYEFGSVFNKDGTAFFYGVDTGQKSEIRFSKLEGEKWSTPITIMADEVYGFNDPFLSPDENRLYFISKMPKTTDTSSSNYDIWYAERRGNGWSGPINAGENINSSNNEYYISFTNEGTMYFSSNKADSNFDIYYSTVKNGRFQPAVALGNAINTSYYEADVFVDPEEQYLIFCAERPEGMGRGDLYISFKNPDGKWEKAKNMGSLINTKGHELCPFVTKDGQYFFFTSNQDIYWVSTAIFKQYKSK